MSNDVSPLSDGREESAARPGFPVDSALFTDAYFLRAKRILQAEGLDPQATMQVFIRQGPGRVFGIDEAVGLLQRFSPLAEHGGAVFGLPEGSSYAPCEPLLHIEGRLQDFVELETLYLGAISAATSLGNGEPAPDLEAVKARAAAIRRLVGDRSLMYFGARHWRWTWEERISKAAVQGGFDACATDAGARAAGLRAGVGTIPHALILAFAHKYGPERAGLEATLAFDRHIDAQIPRIALVDTFNREIDEALAAAKALGPRLWGVRLDTAGENVGQGGAPFDGRAYWTGPGVTVESARAVRDALRAAGFEKTRIALSSGFGDPAKVAAFVEAEKTHGRLFDSLGVGGLFPARIATADVVRVEGREMGKKGRSYRPNPRFVRLL
jgi:nicotinate phosphoribosyltransferase